MKYLIFKNNYKTIQKINLFVWLLFFSLSASPLLLSQNIRDLRILHTNDTHAANTPFLVNKSEVSEITDSIMMVGGIAYLKGYINKYTDTNTIFIDAGDYTQGTPVSSMTKGKSQIIVLNHLMPDVTTLGNHEFDYSSDTLFHFLKEAKFKVIDCNLVEKGTRKQIFDPYIIITKNEIKIALIGVITEELEKIVAKGNVSKIEVLEIIPTVKKYISEIKELEKPNLIILVTHVGYDIDLQIAEAIPEADIIIGGHTHTKIANPYKHNKTIICQAGEKTKYLGIVDLKVNVENNSVHSFIGKLEPVICDYIQPDTLIAKIIDSINIECLNGFEEVIGQLNTNWVRRYNQESEIGNWLTDMIRNYTNADVAFYNAGGIRKNLMAGPITVKDIWEITPFDNSIVSFSIRGDSLLNMIEFQVSDDGKEKLQISGIEYQYNLNNPSGHRISDCKVNKQKIIPSKYYNVATNSFLASQSEQYLGITIDQNRLEDSQKYIKELFIEYVEKQKVINSRIEGRMIQVYK
jgi:2',3'-cyclic-nucleotide 2'-phosphodiesterase (5'-nucleotidase family)